MTRTECEKQIYEKITEILDIVKDYNPDNTYLSISVLNGGRVVQFWNEDWMKDKEKPIDYHKGITEEE